MFFSLQGFFPKATPETSLVSLALRLTHAALGHVARQRRILMRSQASVELTTSNKSRAESYKECVGYGFAFQNDSRATGIQRTRA